MVIETVVEKDQREMVEVEEEVVETMKNGIRSGGGMRGGGDVEREVALIEEDGVDRET